MSQWTHVLGIIRFESMLANVRPEPYQKEKRLMDEVEKIHNHFQRGHTPSGSEGPIQIETILTNRGPTVVIAGDLRDFGTSDVDGIVSWLNDRIEHMGNAGIATWVRDVNISCDVEYLDHFLIVLVDGDNDTQLFQKRSIVYK